MFLFRSIRLSLAENWNGDADRCSEGGRANHVQSGMGVALTAGNADLRQAAAQTLGDLIADHHDDASICHDANQLALPLA